MSQVRASVWLNEVRTGELRQNEQGYIEFHPDRLWQDSPERPVLGQWFEERPGKRQRADRPGDLPSFFANLIPEGDLGLILRDRLGIAADDDLGLLIATGSDLPGAVIVRADGEGADTANASGADDEIPENADEPRLKFSLAGVQLKFSMLRSGNRFIFPGRDARGDWIAKIAREEYKGLCENEFITMEWARRAGFDVPPCELRTLGELVDVPHNGDPATTVFAIRRYDRNGLERIHQEDMMQVLGFPNWPPTRKYNDATYEQLAILLSQIVAQPGAFDEILRRIAFVVASGNNDAHLKNWSLLYRDGISATLTPLYDQTFAGQWPYFDKELALNLGGTKVLAAIDIRRFREFAVRCGHNPDLAAAEVTRTIEHFATAWMAVSSELEIPPAYRAALRHHWASVPVLAPHALLIA